MRLGFNIPNLGLAAGPDGISKVAQRAEALGYDTVWVTERLLFPVNPRTPYAGSPDGTLPDAYKHILDPLDSLTWAAAATKRVGLGTSVLDMPFYNPVLLARRITTIDVLSGGRLRVGFGQGWSEDEFDAAGADPKTRGRRADELIRAMKAIWTQETAEFKGRFFTVPKSVFLPKPVQKPHPPLYFAAFTPAALKRVATLGDGWLPVGIPLNAVQGMWDNVKAMAREAGRNPDKLEIIVRANVELSKDPAGEQRWPFTGSTEEVKGDIRTCREVGVAEVHFDPSFTPEGASVPGFLSTMEKVRELAG